MVEGGGVCTLFLKPSAKVGLGMGHAMPGKLRHLSSALVQKTGLMQYNDMRRINPAAWQFVSNPAFDSKGARAPGKVQTQHQ